MIRSASSDPLQFPGADSPSWKKTIRENPSLDSLYCHLASFTNLNGGVKKLQQLIMRLAVTGKLVPQDENEEHATALLDRIAVRREELIASTVIREKTPIRDKTLPKSPLPRGWAWANFGDISFNRDGERVPVKKADRENQDKTYDYYGASGVIDKVADYIFDQPLLLIGEDGANLINRSTPIAFIAEGKYWVNNHAHVVDLISRDMMNYVALFINSISLEPYITGMAQPKMNQARMNSIPVAVPPEPEQRRIVLKVESLMSLCDELESLRRERGTVRERASRSVLASLTSAPVKKTGKSEETLASAWQRLSDHFEILLDQPENLGHLRQSILQLAVQGKLVRQDPNDESAGELLEAAGSGRAKIIDDYRLRSASQFDAIAVEEEPFQLPDGWRWCRMGEFGAFMGGGTPSKDNSEYWSGNIPWVTPKDMKRPLIKDAIDHVSKEGIDNSSAKLIPSESLLMVVRGMILVHSFPVAISKRKLTINQDMKALVLGDKRLAEYLLLLGQGSRDRVLSLVKRSSHGTCRLATEDLDSFVVGLPPLAEQSRIVEKVASLLLRCEKLSTQLQNQRSALESLITALVHQILEDTR